MGNRLAPWPTTPCLQCSPEGTQDSLHDLVAKLLPPIIGHTRGECPCGYHPVVIEALKAAEERGRLAGAKAEREAVLAIIGQYQGENAFSDHELNHDEEIETETIVGTCQDLIDRIRQRGEAGERPEEEKK